MGAEQRTASSYTSASPMEVSGGRRKVDLDGRTRTDRCHACTRVGKHTLLFGHKRSRFPAQLMVGPDWQCMLCTYTLIVTPTVFFLLGVARNMPLPVLVVGVATFAGALVAFSAAACSDPGIVFREPGQDGRDEEGSAPKDMREERRWRDRETRRERAREDTACVCVVSAAGSHCIVHTSEDVASGRSSLVRGPPGRSRRDWQGGRRAAAQLHPSRGGRGEEDGETGGHGALARGELVRRSQSTREV